LPGRWRRAPFLWYRPRLARFECGEPSRLHAARPRAGAGGRGRIHHRVRGHRSRRGENGDEAVAWRDGAGDAGAELRDGLAAVRRLPARALAARRGATTEATTG